MTTIFLTGATGHMGSAGLKELLSHAGEYGYRIRVLALPGRESRQRLKRFRDRIEIIWGDLRNREDVLRGVTGSDIVLHVGGMVSPKADYQPVTTRETNIGAARNIRDAVIAQGEAQPAVVYIGSVAQMGDRREPLHWGRTGDPVCVSAYDHYGITKVLAERILTDGSIRKWVSLRQSGILYPEILKNFDPIMFHVPIRGVLEWATVEDSGRLLERVCRPGVPEDFWRRYYNIGSGAEYRLSNYDFERLLLETAGCPRPEKIFRARWFTTRNFHGMWYIDGDKSRPVILDANFDQDWGDCLSVIPVMRHGCVVTGQTKKDCSPAKYEHSAEALAKYKDTEPQAKEHELKIRIIGTPGELGYTAGEMISGGPAWHKSEGNDA